MRYQSSRDSDEVSVTMQKHIKPSDNSGVGVVDRVFMDQEVAHRENSDRHYVRK